jgi:hypothetical protein
MLLDISGNTFSSLGSSVPTILVGPRQIYGDSLQVHVDTTDYRNMFSTATGSTNVSLTGQTQVKRIDDISGKGRKFYYFTGVSSVEGVTINGSTIQETFTSTTVNQFSGSSFDTNKGVFGIGTTNSSIVMISPLINTFVTAPDSAATLCFYSYWGGQSAGAPVFGLSRGYSLNPVFYFGQNNNSTILNFYVKNVSRFTFNISAYAQKTSLFLATITGNTYYFYINDTFISSGTMTSGVYPITGVNSSGGYFIDCALASTPQFSGTKTHEGFISHSYTTPEQVKLLYNYFTTKFKNKIDNYR